MSENFLYSKYSIFVLSIVFFLVVIALGRESYLNYKIDGEIINLQQKIEELKKENADLAELEKYFQSEEFLEKEARLKLNLIRDGEKLIIIKEDENKSIEEDETRKLESVSNFRKWWKYFFGR